MQFVKKKGQGRREAKEVKSFLKYALCGINGY